MPGGGGRVCPVTSGWCATSLPALPSSPAMTTRRLFAGLSTESFSARLSLTPSYFGAARRAGTSTSALHARSVSDWTFTGPCRCAGDGKRHHLCVGVQRYAPARLPPRACCGASSTSPSASVRSLSRLSAAPARTETRAATRGWCWSSSAHSEARREASGTDAGGAHELFVTTMRHSAALDRARERPHSAGALDAP